MKMERMETYRTSHNYRLNMKAAYHALRQYEQANGHPPSFCAVHPSTRDEVMLLLSAAGLTVCHSRIIPPCAIAVGLFQPEWAVRTSIYEPRRAAMKCELAALYDHLKYWAGGP